MSVKYAKRFEAVFSCYHPKGPKMTVRTAAKYLRKSPQFVDHWVQRYKETKCVDGLPNRGSKRVITKSEDRAIMRLYSKNLNLFFWQKG
ncbi:hypothetical protein WN51_07975 [Melipona quadrifasciata]|uniref:Uncharacterized protein n=1 Tax=Melipona quadrifasciata TaxID=166423 RepID=A0A0M9AA43_9HYME|nr:hypothetical protein WN51_07975 [Melipona quadrifasciata]